MVDLHRPFRLLSLGRVMTHFSNESADDAQMEEESEASRPSTY